MMLVIERDPAKKKRSVIQGLFVLGCGGYLLYSFLSSGQTYDMILGSCLFLWGAFIVKRGLTTPVLFEEIGDGFVYQGMLKKKHLKWEQLTARTALKARVDREIWHFNDEVSGKERIFWISENTMRAKDVARVKALVAQKRPDLQER